MNKQEKYEDDLKNLLKGDSFKIPEKYFDEMPGKVVEKINLIEGMAKPANPFETPVGYFESLGEKVQGKIAKPAAAPLLRPRLIIPLSLGLILAGIFFFSINNNKEKKTEFSYEDIENSTYFLSIDEQLLFEELVTEGKFNETTDSLTQYILDNNIELSDLENAL